MYPVLTVNSESVRHFILNLGKIAYTSKQRRNPVRLTLRVRQVEGQDWDTLQPTKTVAISVCGEIWNAPGTDCVSVGQNIEEIASLFPEDKKVQRIAELWREWHCNDLKAGTIRQHAALNLPDDSSRPRDAKPEQDWYQASLEALRAVGLETDNGYKFGTEWLVRPITAEVLTEILSLFGVQQPQQTAESALSGDKEWKAPRQSHCQSRLTTTKTEEKS